jgi:hypothetical protein
MDTFDQLTEVAPDIFALLGIGFWFALYTGLREKRPHLQSRPFKDIFAPCILGFMGLKIAESQADTLLWPNIMPFYRFPDVLAHAVTDFAASWHGQAVSGDDTARNYSCFLIIQFTLEAFVVLLLTVGVYDLYHRRKAKSSLNPPH